MPKRIVSKILDYSSRKGDLIMDPFVGTGQVPYVSRVKRRKYTGIEIDADICKFANQRMQMEDYLPMMDLLDYHGPQLKI